MWNRDSWVSHHAFQLGQRQLLATSSSHFTRKPWSPGERERRLHTNHFFIGRKTFNPNFETLLLHAGAAHWFVQVFRPSARDEPLRKDCLERRKVTSGVTPALPSLLLIPTQRPDRANERAEGGRGRQIDFAGR